MHSRPEIAALRGDGSPQRADQARLAAAVDHWRAAHGPLLNDIARYGSGAALADCPELDALFAPNALPLTPIEAFVAEMLGALAAAPLGHVAVPHATNCATSTLMLAQSGDATLTLIAEDAAGMDRIQSDTPQPLTFMPAKITEKLLAGAFTVALHRRHRDNTSGLASVREVAMQPGAVLAYNGRVEAPWVMARSRSAVVLRLTRAMPGAGAVEQVDPASGAVVFRATADLADSRRELMAAVVGRMRRRDAAPLLAAIAREHGAGGPGMRWQALRESLALDSAAGFAALAHIADSATDPLAAPAGALRARLVAEHPQFAVAERCPA